MLSGKEIFQFFLTLHEYIESGCPTMSRVDNGKITYMNAKASAMLFCEPNFEIVGSNFAHCNGTNWDRVIGTCKETDNLPPTSCDLESKNENYTLV